MRFTIDLPKEFIKISNPPYSEVVEYLINDPTILRATKYMSPNLVVRAVRRSWRAFGRKTRVVENIQVALTIGRPNYLEREFIELCKKAREPFPIKKVQLKFYKPQKGKLKSKK